MRFYYEALTHNNNLKHFIVIQPIKLIRFGGLTTISRGEIIYYVFAQYVMSTDPPPSFILNYRRLSLYFNPIKIKISRPHKTIELSPSTRRQVQYSR